MKTGSGANQCRALQWHSSSRPRASPASASLGETGVQTRLFQTSACANGDARQGLLGDRDSEASFGLQAAIDATQKRAAADEHQASLHHIRRQFRRCPLERRPHGLDDALERNRECVPYLVGGDHGAPQQARG
jgi:hypothetical protein